MPPPPRQPRWAVLLGTRATAIAISVSTKSRATGNDARSGAPKSVTARRVRLKSLAFATPDTANTEARNSLLTSRAIPTAAMLPREGHAVQVRWCGPLAQGLERWVMEADGPSNPAGYCGGTPRTGYERGRCGIPNNTRDHAHRGVETARANASAPTVLANRQRDKTAAAPTETPCALTKSHKPGRCPGQRAPDWDDLAGGES